ncbi:AAA-like domain-containing protein, partial [candidate division KSB1 bacterium]|nr:AAA-like domain-containing protein [candidate division KSB1 bacterium]
MHELQHYTVGGTVHVDALYVFRQADKDLLDLCRAGEFAFILSSRQVGKSSLMLRTAKQLAEEGIQCVKLTLEEVGKVTTTPEQFYYGILHEIQKELQFQTKPHVWWQAHGHLSLAQRFSKFFGDVLLREVEAPIVVFIDEIDTTLNLPYSDDFFAAIRSLYNARADRPEFRRLSFVLIGVATPNDLIKDYTRTPFNIGKRVEVTDFTLEEARPLAEGFDLPDRHA